MCLSDRAVPAESGQHLHRAYRLRALVLLLIALHLSYPRLFYLTDSTSTSFFDPDNSTYNNLAIGLNATYSSVFNMMQYHWSVYSNDPYEPDVYEKGVSFWVVNECVLSRSACSYA